MQAFCNNSSHFHMKDCSPPLPKRKLGSPNTEGLEIFPAPSYMIEKKLNPHKKYLWEEWVYTM